MQRNMFEIKCSDCGETAMVPFKPTAGKPAYCRKCFSKRRGTQSENFSKPTTGFDPKQAWARRRDNGQAKKEAALPSFVRWSFRMEEATTS
jgi:CxxC-x17-CxxC domain-containing protein